MRKELTEHHFQPLSTRMIFLHHRVRMHDRAGLNTPQGDETARAMSSAARFALAAFPLAAVVLLGVVFHA